MKDNKNMKSNEKTENFEDLFKKPFVLDDGSAPTIEINSADVGDPVQNYAIVKSDNFLSALDKGQGNSDVSKLLKVEIRGIMQEVLDGIQMELMKPMEQNAFFIAGKLVQENNEIREKYEMVLQDNEKLRERLEMLPAPPEKVHEVLQEKEEQLKLADSEISAKMQELDEVSANLRKHEKAVSFLSNTQTRLRDREETLAETYREMDRKHKLMEEIRVQLHEKESSLSNVLQQQKQLLEALRQLQILLNQRERENADLKEKNADKDLQIADFQLQVVKERNRMTEILRDLKRLESVQDNMRERLMKEQAEKARISDQMDNTLTMVEKLKEENLSLQQAYLQEKGKTWLQKLMGK